MTDLLARIERRTVKADDGCWRWTGATAKGYGCIGIEGKTRLVHRAAYELLVGPIPEGLQIDHHCHNIAACRGGDACLHRRCWRPSHLRVVTPLENTRSRPRPHEVCRRMGGHVLTGPVHVDSVGPARMCKQCLAWVRDCGAIAVVPTALRQMAAPA